MFDHSRMAWKAVEGDNTPRPRFDSGLTFANGRLFLFGGRINLISAVDIIAQLLWLSSVLISVCLPVSLHDLYEFDLVNLEWILLERLIYFV